MWRDLSRQELMEEYARLKAHVLCAPKLYSNVGMKCSDQFFQYVRLNTARRGKVSSAAFFDANTALCQEKAKQHRCSMRAIAVQRTDAPSQFPPCLFRLLCQKFECKSVIDPFAGWGDRCLAAMSMNVDYLGIDSNPELASPYKRMVSAFPHTCQVQILINDSLRELSRRWSHRRRFDAMISSPPFYKQGKVLELYKNVRENWKDFIPVMETVIDFASNHCNFCFLDLPGDSHACQLAQATAKWGQPAYEFCWGKGTSTIFGWKLI